MSQIYRILVVNPGSTSTKIAVYDNENEIFTKVIPHSSELIGKFNKIVDQFDFRKEMVINTLKEQGLDLNSLDIVVGRGGNMKPVEGGTYAINERMVEDLRIGVMGEHASNLGGLIAWDIANLLNIPSYVVDPVVVDELEDLARISGMPKYLANLKIIR